MNRDNILRSIFFFDTMITPKIITFVYWLLLLAVIIGGIYVMTIPFFGGFFKGLLVIIVGVIYARIMCELLMVLFKINEYARRIADAQAPIEATGRGMTDGGIGQSPAPQGAAE